MATELNKINCGTEAKNTGTGKCALDLGFIRKHLKVQDDTHVFTPEEIAAIEDTLRDMILADPSERLYPFPNWEQITDNSDELQITTLGYGRKSYGSEGYNDYTFDFLDGAHCAWEALKSHEGVGSYLLVDSNLRLIGQTVDGGLMAIPMDLKVLKPKIATGSAATIYQARFIFDPIYLGTEIGFIDRVPGFNPLLLEGLQDVTLTIAATSTATSVKFTAATGCSHESMGDIFPVLGTTAGDWQGIATAGGAIVTPTAAAFNSTTKVFTLTFAAAVSSVSLIDPADLATAGIDGFESNVLSPVIA